MTNWTLIQIIFDLFVTATIMAIFWRLRRPPQDDPRLSRGLQLLQTKITVLEDLSDRTDAQVKQLSSIIDQKTRALQNKMIEAEQQILKMEGSFTKAVSSIEPSTEGESAQADILERQRTVEYVKAARMAHSGMAPEQIAESVNLPIEQIELIAKFNRDQLMFDENQLPEWATKENARAHFGLNNMDFVGHLDRPRPNFQELAKLENSFRQAVQDVKKADEAAQISIMETKVAESIKNSLSTGMDTVQPAVMAVKATAQTLKDKLVATAEDMLRQQNVTDVSKVEKTTIKKVIFPRIEKP